mmetsp:Transcript_119490/g.334684  ORF Transcript_119490/g.334684 Transcript_119490/m.334684 type:complete len:221 (+) Transcript_119490:372-1034(+)
MAAHRKMRALGRQPHPGEEARRRALLHADDAQPRGIPLHLRGVPPQAAVRLDHPRTADLLGKALKAFLQLVSLDLLVEVPLEAPLVVELLEVGVANELAAPCMGDPAAQPLADALQPIRVDRPHEDVGPMNAGVSQPHLAAHHLPARPIEALHVARGSRAARVQAPQVHEQLMQLLPRAPEAHGVPGDDAQAHRDRLLDGLRRGLTRAAHDNHQDGPQLA